MVRLVIKPNVIGKRIQLIRTDDPYLKHGDRGTVVDVSELPYEDMPFKVLVQWDSGSNFQSWKDATIIGRFTTMTMIKNILIITVIAALVPTAMSSVSAPADAEIALFSRASVDTDSLSITGNGDSAKMELKVTNDNGKSIRVSDFQLTADNVLSTEVGDKVTVIDNVDFTRAITTDARNSQKAIGITSNGVIGFAGYTQGVYTLDVVVDDDRAYEAIIAIGDQTNQIVDKEITRVNSEYTIEFVFPPIEDPKPPKCNDGEELIDGKCEPVYCLDAEGSECPPYQTQSLSVVKVRS